MPKRRYNGAFTVSAHGYAAGLMFASKESVVMLVLSFVVVSNLYDLYIDIAGGASRWHLFEETFLVLVSTGVILWLTVSLVAQRRSLEQLKNELRERHAAPVPPDPAALAARRQLGKTIRAQFAQWNLTESEQAVALLLLKGLSFKEIAAVRNTLEKTVRQQASGIYRKAGVSGRHAFSAWFIEDIL